MATFFQTKEENEILPGFDAVWDPEEQSWRPEPSPEQLKELDRLRQLRKKRTALRRRRRTIEQTKRSRRYQKECEAREKIEQEYRERKEKAFPRFVIHHSSYIAQAHHNRHWLELGGRCVMVKRATAMQVLLRLGALGYRRASTGTYINPKRNYNRIIFNNHTHDDSEMVIIAYRDDRGTDSAVGRFRKVYSTH